MHCFTLRDPPSGSLTRCVPSCRKLVALDTSFFIPSIGIPSLEILAFESVFLKDLRKKRTPLM
jgi:hypothetical protein